MRWNGTYNSTAYDLAVVIILRDGITPSTHPIEDSVSEAEDFYSGSLNITATTDKGDVTVTGTFEVIPSDK